jgi:hypothetical protein
VIRPSLPTGMLVVLFVTACPSPGTRTQADSGSEADASRGDGGESLDAGTIVCAQLSDCPSSFYCAGTVCGTAGTCAPLPTGCGGNLSEVCGCDGNTYVNACLCESAGVRVASLGACPVPDAGVGGCGTVTCNTGQVCCESTASCYDPTCTSCCPGGGAACQDNATCGAGQYCAGTGCATTGACQNEPVACPPVFAPVCGCDGESYTNSCGAESVGVRVASDGPCGAADAGADAGFEDAGTHDGGVHDGGMTTCTGDSDCASTDYCAGTGCGTPGTCAAKPAMNSCGNGGPKVCGCDNVTYANTCAAESTGVRVATHGGCADAGTASDAGSGRTDAGESDAGHADAGRRDAGTVEDAGTADAGGCTSNTDCAHGEYCNGTTCTDVGSCTPIPTGPCSPRLQPVCGCNDMTYVNACSAEQAGERIASDGGCAPATPDAGAADAGPSCTSNNECSTGELCCPSTMKCYSRACLACCPP